MVTKEQLRELLDYQDGHFIEKKTGKVKNETPITAQHRYQRVVVLGKAYPLHRLVFLYHHGFLPKIIDHADNDRSNNRIENLREVTQQQNCLNRKAHKNNKSGAKNVHWEANMKKWRVLVTVDGKRRNLGAYEDLEFAAMVAHEARDKFHGHFARG